jgi:Uma2 family endonuclease
MQADANRARMTYDDLLALPNDGMRHELIDGEHFVTPSPAWTHQQIVGNLHRLIANHVRANRLGVIFVAPLDVVLTEHDVVEPDVIFFTPESFNRHIGERVAEGPPDLAVEVLSPSTRRRDEILKRRLYERMGVGEYWIVDPEIESLKVFRLNAGKYERMELRLEGGDSVSSPLFPGLHLTLASIFEMPDVSA